MIDIFNSEILLLISGSGVRIPNGSPFKIKDLRVKLRKSFVFIDHCLTVTYRYKKLCRVDILIKPTEYGSGGLGFDSSCASYFLSVP